MRDERNWALVLGVSGGTGAAIARQVTARCDLNLFGVHRGRHPEDAFAVEQDALANGAQVHFLAEDASKFEMIEPIADRLLDVAGPQSVRLAVHSLADASIGPLAASAPFHPKQFEKTFHTMAHSFVYWAQTLANRNLLAPGATILALTNPFADSICGGFGMVGAAKAALEVYVRYLAFELGPKGFRVNLLKFGLVETEAVRRAIPADSWNGIVQRLSVVTPYRRICTTDDVARFVTQLVQDDATWCNGATIDLTGGQLQSLLHHVFYPEQRPAA